MGAVILRILSQSTAKDGAVTRAILSEASETSVLSVLLVTTQSVLTSVKLVSLVPILCVNVKRLLQALI